MTDICESNTSTLNFINMYVRIANCWIQLREAEPLWGSIYYLFLNWFSPSSSHVCEAWKILDLGLSGLFPACCGCSPSPSARRAADKDPVRDQALVGLLSPSSQRGLDLGLGDLHLQQRLGPPHALAPATCPHAHTHRLEGHMPRVTGTPLRCQPGKAQQCQENLLLANFKILPLWKSSFLLRKFIWVHLRDTGRFNLSGEIRQLIFCWLCLLRNYI